MRFEHYSLRTLFQGKRHPRKVGVLEVIRFPTHDVGSCGCPAETAPPRAGAA